MALRLPTGGVSVSRQALRHCRGILLQPISSTRPFSLSIPRRDAANETTPKTPSTESSPPRWAQTPERMKAPFTLTVAKNPERQIWHVNEDPDRLDLFYNRFLGSSNGERMLPDELKWLAVTHKSFDYGRRGFNTRLAHFGRHILAVEATRSVMSSQNPMPLETEAQQWRQPFEHPALANVDKLTHTDPSDLISRQKICKLAIDTGLHEVVRWKPRNPQNLSGSGLSNVLQGTVYAILGALSLQHGAEVASRICRERVLKKMES